MKFKLLASLLVFGSTSFAMAEEPAGIWADGSVIYKHPDGNLVTRDCNLWVPARGQGSVTLKCGDWETSTETFFTTKADGKTTFSILFTNMPGAPEGNAALYQGAYIRGNNLAFYYGDVLSGERTCEACSDMTWTYVGGFKFSKEIE